MLYAPLKIVKCRVCGLIYRDEVDIDNNYYRQLDRYHQYLLDDERLAARKRDAVFRFNLLKTIVRPQCKVLDIGANDGSFMLEAEKAGLKAFGCEPNRYAAEYSRRLGLKVIDKYFEDAFAELKEEAPFHLVALFHVLEHLPDPIKTLGMIKGIISPDGYLIIEVPDISSPISRIFSWDDLRISKEHLFYFDRRTLNDLLKKSGFSTVYCHRKVWDGLNRSWLENIIRLPAISEAYMLLRRVKNKSKGFFGIKPPPRKNLDDNIELWCSGKMQRRHYPFSYVLGRIIFQLNRGDDLFAIARH